MEITYIDSKEITNSSQLKEVFRDHCGVMVDGCIYTSIDSILDRDLKSKDSFELHKIHSMAFSIFYTDKLWKR